jgi:hypothetical protein
MNPFLLVITTVYTTVAIIAVALHALNLREALLNQHAIRSVEDRLGQEWATMVVRSETARLAKAVLIAGLGVGVLIGFRMIGWILIPIPFIGIVASWLDLKSRERQAIYAEGLLAAQRERENAPNPDVH